MQNSFSTDFEPSMATLNAGSEKTLGIFCFGCFKLQNTVRYCRILILLYQLGKKLDIPASVFSAVSDRRPDNNQLKEIRSF